MKQPQLKSLDPRPDSILNLIIAEWLGWTSFQTAGFQMQGIPPGPTLKDRVDLPDYCQDLNSIRQAVHNLTREEYDAPEGFTFWLARVVHGMEDGDEVGFDFYEMQEASARQRCEALVALVEKRRVIFGVSEEEAPRMKAVMNDRYGSPADCILALYTEGCKLEQELEKCRRDAQVLAERVRTDHKAGGTISQLEEQLKHSSGPSPS